MGAQLQQKWLAWLVALFFAALLISALSMLLRSYSRIVPMTGYGLSTQINYLSTALKQDTLRDVERSIGWLDEYTTGLGVFETESKRWARVRLLSQVDYPQTVYVLVDNPTLDFIDLFVFNENNEFVDRRFLGVKRDHTHSADYSFPHIRVTLPPFEQFTVYVNGRTEQGAALPLLVYTESQFNEHKETTLLLWGALIGLVFVVILYFISLYHTLGDPVYLFFSVFAIFIFVYMSVHYGYSFHIFPVSIGQMFNRQFGFATLGLVAMVVIFTRLYVNERAIGDWTPKKVWSVYVAFLSLLVLLPVTQRHWVYFTLALMPVLWFLFLFRLVQNLQKGNDWASFYLFSLMPLSIGFPVTLMATLEWIPSNFLTRYALFLAIVFQFSMSAFSFSKRLSNAEEGQFHQANFDGYTGLSNRSLLEYVLRKQIAQNQPFTLVLIEVGSFLKFLPYIGTESASTLVKTVASELSWLLQSTDRLEIVSELEYARAPYLIRDHILAIPVYWQSDLDTIVRQIHQICDSEIRIADFDIAVQPIVSSVEYPKHSLSVEDLIQKAMQALDYGKREDQPYTPFVPELIQFSQRQIRLAADIRRALNENEFELYHQPQINLSDRSVYGSEVLLRWNHPELGMVSPDQFIPLAEDIGLINALTEHVIERAFRQQQRISALGYQHQLSINISGKDVNSQDFYMRVQSLMKKYQIPAGKVTLELTESVTVKDKDVLKVLMDKFFAIGVHFSIDDFGTGFSSLEALSDLNFQELKIDRSFVMDMLKSTRSYTISEATIDLATRLKLVTVAEGVEDEQVIAILKACKCQIAQGYYFSRPLPFNDYLAWLQHYHINIDAQSE